MKIYIYKMGLSLKKPQVQEVSSPKINCFDADAEIQRANDYKIHLIKNLEELNKKDPDFANSGRIFDLYMDHLSRVTSFTNQLKNCYWALTVKHFINKFLKK